MPRKATQQPEQEILPPESEEKTELAILTPQTAVTVLQDDEEFSKLYAKVKAETDKLKPDTSTQKGRDAIRSLARKVVTTRTTIDKARLQLTSEWRDMTNKVNAANKTIEAKLDALAEEVRRPLTEWEDAEKAREQFRVSTLNEIANLSRIEWDDDSVRIAERAALLKAIVIDEADWGEELDTVASRRSGALDNLRAAYTKAKQAEDAAAELERLKQAEEARQAAEAERLAQEAAELAAKEQAEREAKEAEEKRIADAKALEDAKTAAAAKAAQEERERAEKEVADKLAAIQAERDAEAKAKQDEIDAANARAAEIERKAKEAADALAKIEADRIAKEKAAAEAQRKRDEDMAHRSAIMKSAKEALMKHADIDEAIAKRVVLAITGGHVPNTKVTF